MCRIRRPVTDQIKQKYFLLGLNREKVYCPTRTSVNVRHYVGQQQLFRWLPGSGIFISAGLHLAAGSILLSKLCVFCRQQKMNAVGPTLIQKGCVQDPSC